MTPEKIEEIDKWEPQMIGFMIEGENMVIANPCTIPIEILKEALKKPRKKNEVTSVGMIQIPLNLLPKKTRDYYKNRK